MEIERLLILSCFLLLVETSCPKWHCTDQQQASPNKAKHCTEFDKGQNTVNLFGYNYCDASIPYCNLYETFYDRYKGNLDRTEGSMCSNVAKIDQQLQKIANTYFVAYLCFPSEYKQNKSECEDQLKLFWESIKEKDAEDIRRAQSLDDYQKDQSESNQQDTIINDSFYYFQLSQSIKEQLIQKKKYYQKNQANRNLDGNQTNQQEDNKTDSQNLNNQTQQDPAKNDTKSPEEIKKAIFWGICDTDKDCEGQCICIPNRSGYGRCSTTKLEFELLKLVLLQAACYEEESVYCSLRQLMFQFPDGYTNKTLVGPF